PSMAGRPVAPGRHRRRSASPGRHHPHHRGPLVRYLHRIESPVGPLELVGDGEHLTGLFYPGHSKGLPTEGTRAAEPFAAVIQQLGEYFAGERTEFDLPIALHGTPFQMRCWRALQRIGYGQRRSYGQIAAEIGEPGAARAVGLANSRNPISIIVPCHRVVGADGSLTGYGGGVSTKDYLLELESRAARLF